MHGNRYVKLHEEIIRCITTQMTKKSFRTGVRHQRQQTGNKLYIYAHSRSNVSKHLH